MSIEKIDSYLKKSLPDANERKQVLQYLAYIITEANRIKPDNWCLNCTRGRLKFTVGKPYLFHFGPWEDSGLGNEPILVVGGSKSEFTKETLAALKPYTSKWKWPTIRPENNNVVFFIPAKKISLFTERLEEFKKAITELISRASTGTNKHLNASVASAKDDALVDYLRTETRITNIPLHTKKLLEDASPIKAWIFQGNPSLFKMREYLNSRDDIVWRVSHHADEIKVGDQVLIWETGKESRILALAEITEAPSEMIAEDALEFWIEEPDRIKKRKRCRLTVIERFEDQLTKDRLLNVNPTLPNLRFANGTNFPITIEQLNQILNLLEENNMAVQSDLSLNTIIYGPPGTGKTYYIQQELMPRFSSKTLSEHERLTALIEDYAWWEIIGAALTDYGNKTVPELIQHPLIKAKVAQSSAKNKNAILWQQLQLHTDPQCENVKFTSKQAPYIFWKEDNSIWRTVPETVKSEAPRILELLAAFKNPTSGANSVSKRYTFVTFHQSYSYEEFVEGIKPDLTEGTDAISYSLADGIFKKMAIRAANDPDNEYAIFIDEINRGNISRIFGELISVIEKDKRTGAANALTVELPYSRKEFGVPSNLYIIGTMNTADRSLVNIDVALRRRFQFVPLYPTPSAVKDQQLRAVMIALNEQIRTEKDIDHQIGHSYFMGKSIIDLPSIVREQILPLLIEYFYGETDTIFRIFENIPALKGRLSTNSDNGLLEFK